MKKSNLILGILFLFTLLSCDKSEKKQIDDIGYYNLTISRNDKLFQVFKYNNDKLLSQINYDTLGIIKEKIYFSYSSLIIKKDFYTADSVLKLSMIYKLKSNSQIDTIYTINNPSEIDDLKHGYLFRYLTNGNLDLVMDKMFSTGEHLDINFKWIGNNVSEKNFSITTGYPHYSYEYDDHPSIYKLIKSPIDVNIGNLEVAEIPISNNNIKKVNIKKLVNNDLIFDTVRYELYNSQMTYDKSGYLKIEIRNYSTKTVRLDYKIDTIR